MANVDPIATIADWLQTQTTVKAAVLPSRIYADELPQQSYMPGAAVIISGSGGPGDRTLMNLGRQRIDVRVYGKRLRDARALSAVVHQALKHLTRVVFNGALIHSVDLEGGPVDSREPKTDWPVVFTSYQVLYAEQT